MSSGSKSRKQSGKQDEAAARARRKQIIVALVIGAVVGVVISALTEFWLWLPAGLAMGLATGAIMKPPSD
ncbi:HPP family protein [Leucobacter tenebrionis]|uniref:HPP family protein n=1 Tax=Leucobacter tenebrionis TaxID=2873270 RepID=UPI001CA7404C|nr:HPP family protein [Leucobacter tenebrionis]QZY52883.1 HPP family protein [Leucobacter tenebrionis]